MMEIENWMKQYCGAVRAAFGDRVGRGFLMLLRKAGDSF